MDCKLNKRILSFVLASLIAVLVTPVFAHDADADDPHAHHHMVQKMMQSNVEYTAPKVSLVRDDGKFVSLSDELNDGRPVIMNFIYTTCTAVCPISSKTFEQFQDKLGDERTKVHMVSVSIDPEQDTVARLSEYAHKYHAGAQWQHYTGTTEASLATQRAFDVYRGDKMNHAPVTLLRAAPGKPWLRIEGFTSADDLLHEYHKLVAVN